VEIGYDPPLPVDSVVSRQAILARLDHRDYAAAFTWITARGGGVTFVVSGRRRVRVDHSGCAVELAWIMAAAP
jgi:hypothetical protein